MQTRPFVWFHSDSYIPECSCGDRDWQLDLPWGWIWKDHRGPAHLTTQSELMDYAASLYPGHPDILPMDRQP